MVFSPWHSFLLSFRPAFDYFSLPGRKGRAEQIPQESVRSHGFVRCSGAGRLSLSGQFALLSIGSTCAALLAGLYRLSSLSVSFFGCMVSSPVGRKSTLQDRPIGGQHLPCWPFSAAFSCCRRALWHEEAVLPSSPALSDIQQNASSILPEAEAVNTRARSWCL